MAPKVKKEMLAAVERKAQRSVGQLQQSADFKPHLFLIHQSSTGPTHEQLFKIKPFKASDSVNVCRHEGLFGIKLTFYLLLTRRWRACFQFSIEHMCF